MNQRHRIPLSKDRETRCSCRPSIQPVTGRAAHTVSLTGTPFLLTAIVLVAVALIVPLVLWSRIPGPALVRSAAGW